MSTRFNFLKNKEMLIEKKVCSTFSQCCVCSHVDKSKKIHQRFNFVDKSEKENWLSTLNLQLLILYYLLKNSLVTSVFHHLSTYPPRLLLLQ